MGSRFPARAKPPSPKRKTFSKRLLSWRYWSAVAVGLGLFASVWATFIGQSVPQLLADDGTRIRDFRKQVDGICRDNANMRMVIDEGWVPEPLVTAVYDERGNALRVPVWEAETAADLVQALQNAPSQVEADLAAVVPPEQLAEAHAAFLQSFRSLVKRIDEITDIPSVSDGGLLTPTDALSGDLQRAWGHDFRKIAAAAERARDTIAPLGLVECESYVSNGADLASYHSAQLLASARSLSRHR